MRISDWSSDVCSSDLRVFSDDPLPLAALRSVDGQVKLAVERLRVAGLELTEVQAVAALQGGDLAVAPLTAGLAGGSLDGRLDLKAAQPEPAAALRLDGQDVDIGEFLRQAGVHEGIGRPLGLGGAPTGHGAAPPAH